MNCVSYVLLGYDYAFLADCDVCQQDCGFFRHGGVGFVDVDWENGDDVGWEIYADHHPHVEMVYDGQDLVTVYGRRENDVWAMGDVQERGALELEQQLFPVHQFVLHPCVSLHSEHPLVSDSQCRQILY